MVRHGQSTANVAYAEAERTGSTVPVPGRDADVPLSGPGRAQAEALGGWLAGISAGGGGGDGGPGPDLVVCSPYVRARQTWESMAEHPGVVPPRSSSTNGCGTGRRGSSSCTRRARNGPVRPRRRTGAPWSATGTTVRRAGRR
ncbi:phosphoglycerate mutase family protein [Streptomyces scabiei]|uniref:phosphoglycerate mutase family protein n=1 Tax=Streptomyces scabiei TaxID=1930 RepID=UPI0035AB8CF1